MLMDRLSYFQKPKPMKKPGAILTLFFLILLFTSNAQSYIGFSSGLLWTEVIKYNTVKYTSTGVDFYNSFNLGVEIGKHASKIFSIGSQVTYDH
jgi:hypothetical protein